jgi:hypothetical protein
MANLNGFDANTVEPSSTFDPLPAGKYLAAITGTEMKPTKDGTGSYLNIELTILDGEFKDRKVWDRLCLNHPNAQTVKIARGNLSALCRAVGVMQPRDSVELHNIPLVVTVKLKKREDTGELANEVKGYAKKETAAGKPQQTAPTDNTPPWRR